VVSAVLGGCAHYTVTFNQAQTALDHYRHTQNSILKGSLP